MDSVVPPCVIFACAFQSDVRRVPRSCIRRMKSNKCKLYTISMNTWAACRYKYYKERDSTGVDKLAIAAKWKFHLLYSLFLFYCSLASLKTARDHSFCCRQEDGSWKERFVLLSYMFSNVVISNHKTWRPGCFFTMLKKYYHHTKKTTRERLKRANFIGDVPKEERDPGAGWVGSFFIQMTGICEYARRSN